MFPVSRSSVFQLQQIYGQNSVLAKFYKDSTVQAFRSVPDTLCS